MTDWYNDPPETPEPPQWLFDTETAIEESREAALAASAAAKRGHPSASAAVGKLAASVEFLAGGLAAIADKLAAIDGELQARAEADALANLTAEETTAEEHPPCLKCHKPNPNGCWMCDDCGKEEPEYDFERDDLNYQAARNK